MRIDARLPVGKFAAEVPGAIAAFEALGIDYACAPELSLEDAAHAEGISPDIVIASLRRLTTVQRGDSWSDRPLVDLVRHLAQQHHYFVRHKLGRLAMLLADLCTPQELAPPDLLVLRAAFTRLTAIVLPHLAREEAGAFSAIEALERMWQTGQSSGAAPGDLAATLRKLADEHLVIAGRVRTIRELRLRLADSEDLSPRASAMLEDVAALETHLHEYMFLENWILFPRACALIEQTGDQVPAAEE